MPDQELVRAIVLDALGALNQQRAVADRFSPARDTIVYGEDGALDSLELVTFIMEVEQRLEERLGASVALADDRAVSRRVSPFRSVPSFVDFIVSRLEERAHGG